ncbi:MAG: FtsX-like permease family protein [Gemmataceae bacterium]
MYKLLLCWRYLKTRYLAIACIISVMLGVATLIVVNSVMSGFSTKLRDRLHGLLSDMVVESWGMEGFDDPQGKMAQIRRDPFLGPRVVAMTATQEVAAMIQVEGGRARPVRVIGVEPEGRSAIGGFKEYLERQKDAPVVSFELSQEQKEAYQRRERLLLEMHEREMRMRMSPLGAPLGEGELPPPAPTPAPVDEKGEMSVPCGVIVGHIMAHLRRKDENGVEQDIPHLKVGESIVLTTISGQKMQPVAARFVVIDYFKSGMSDYDNGIVFVPLSYLQHLRTTPDNVTSIQIKLKDYSNAEEVKQVKAALHNLLARDNPFLQVATWEDKQGPLLAAIGVEKSILNILLFLIVGVAGFSILAIFTMIVAEKTRDIGILKALGASNGGVMKIFLGYGLLLGLVGAALGSAIGLAITRNINEVEHFVSKVTGQEVFPRDIYYFKEIPTDTQTSMVLFVNLGAIGIAVVFSILPALRAAWLHPVRALRFE